MNAMVETLLLDFNSVFLCISEQDGEQRRHRQHAPMGSRRAGKACVEMCAIWRAINPSSLLMNTTQCITLTSTSNLFNLILGYASKSTPRRLHDCFCAYLLQGLLWRHLRGNTHFREEAKDSSKMANGSANENCSFNCKWQRPMEAAILKATDCCHVPLSVNS